MQYRRAFFLGGSYFFTVVTERRRPLLATPEAIDLLRNALRTVRAARPFTIDAIVILPDHLHCIWTLPPEDIDFSTRWRLIKTWFTKHYDPELRPTPHPARSAKGAQMLWQQRFWEHALRDEVDFARHVDYIHYNPVKHGLVAAVGTWPYSSFHRYVDKGIYPVDWGGNGIDVEGVGQE
jgi:putative transposase